MKTNPLSDRVLVIRIDENEKATGGIIIPENAKRNLLYGKPAAVGCKKEDENGKRISLEAKTCDHVLLGKCADKGFRVDVIEYLITREGDIIDIIEMESQKDREFAGNCF